MYVMYMCISLFIIAGESRQSMEVIGQTKCGVPSPIANANVTQINSTLLFLWNQPEFFNGDISQELYKVDDVLIFLLTRFMCIYYAI